MSDRIRPPQVASKGRLELRHGAPWDVLGGNLPSVNVMDFIVHPRDRMLVIGTHGRGVWAIDVSKIAGR